jgi:predicted  nucleic acid-binding Zn-ribbon protein
MWDLEIRNIAGIKQGETTLEDGVNVVQASNWQGKSSLVQAITTAMGTSRPLTEGEPAGKVELHSGDEDYRIELRRENGRIIQEGSPYLTSERDRACADLFAFLDERNPIREAVRTNGDLKPLLTRPLDLENIDQQIRDRQQERDRLDREIETVERQANRQDTLQQRVTKLEGELEELREEYAAIESESEDGGDDHSEELTEKRTELERTRRTIEQRESQIDRLEDQLEEKREALEDLELPEAADVQEELADAEEQHDEVQSEIDVLETIYNTNKQILENDQVDVVTDVDRQLSGDDVACWVCGQEAERSAIEDRLEGLSEEISERRQLVAELQSEIHELKDTQQEREQAQRRERNLEDSISELEHRLTEKRADLETAEERRGELETTVEELEDSIEETADQADELESEITRVEVRLEDAREELEDAESAAEELQQLEDQREEIAEEIATLRDRKDAVISDLVDSFEASITTVIDVFDPSFESARLVDTDDGFELVIARDGREVGVDALSEGEVELLGFVVALAGYLTYDVSERVPVMVLDAMGGLAGEHLQKLVAFLEEQAPMVVTTCYPEQGDFGETLVSPSEWEVVSDSVA